MNPHPDDPAPPSAMSVEARAAPQAVAAMLARDGELVDALGRALRERPPRGTLTLARGSSDHAAHYFAYLVMTRLGRLVTSLPMSVITLHGSRLDADGLLAVAFSQSGRSPDLVEPLRRLRDDGARTVAVVNDTASPLAQAAEQVLPLHCGAERSVAATKSFLAQLAAGARLAAAWQGDDGLRAALDALPAALQRAADLSWAAAVDALAAAERLYVLGRGTGLPVAQEAALKFKETCGIQAEAYSAAEVQHGPMALVGAGFPLLVLAPRGPAQAHLLEVAGAMRARGAEVLLAAPDDVPVPAGVTRLPTACAPHADLDPLCVAQTFYGMVEALARSRGRDPDRPPHLSKVTRTL